jgi:hypothetical protein
MKNDKKEEKKTFYVAMNTPSWNNDYTVYETEEEAKEENDTGTIIYECVQVKKYKVVDEKKLVEVNE